MRVAIAIAVLAPALAAADPGWEVRIPDRTEIAVGGTGTLSITVAADRGNSISKDGGVILDLKTDPTITLKKKRLSRGDAADPEADAPRFAIPLKVESLGDREVKVRLRFWVCASRTCRPIDVSRSAKIAVIPAS